MGGAVRAVVDGGVGAVVRGGPIKGNDVYLSRGRA